MPKKRPIEPALVLLVGLVATTTGEAQAGQWDGLFFGANLGAVQSRTEYRTGPNNTGWFSNTNQTSLMWSRGHRTDSAAGPIAGLSMAYARQFDSFVFGAELGLNALSAGLDQTRTYPYNIASRHFTYRQQSDVKGLYTLRGRAGYAFDNSLLSVVGGLAATSLRTGVDYYDDYPGTARYDAHRDESKFAVGWTAGLAYRYMLPGDLVLKAEYAHVDLGRTSFSTLVHDGSGLTTGELNFSSRVHLNTFMIGLEKKF